jgi:SAM-dependent methyltransferase
VKEADIRPAPVLDEYLRLSEADVAEFFPDVTSRAHRGCPGCGADDAAPAYTKRGFELVTCRGCGTLYVDPAPRPERLDAFYRDSPSTRYWSNVFFPTVAEARRIHVFRPRAADVRAILDQNRIAPRRLIDVGAGAGLFLEEFAKVAPGAELVAVEPGRDLARMLSAKGFHVCEGFAADAAVDWGSAADAVTCFEVIEHVLDARALLAELGALARPGGLVLVSGVHGGGFDIAALGRHSKAIVPPHHLNFLSREGVEALVRRAGLDLVAFTTPGKLDVDIVVNALKDDPSCVADAALRDRLLKSTEAERAALQGRIVADRRSSHMWIVARRRVA